jgi:hypothetical protein
MSINVTRTMRDLPDFFRTFLAVENHIPPKNKIISKTSDKVNNFKKRP